MTNDRQCLILVESAEPCVLAVHVNDICAEFAVRPDQTSITVDITHVVDTWASVTVQCLQGRCGIGPVKFNHSWTVNQEFCQAFPELWNQLTLRGFDLSGATDAELDLIAQHGVFVSCGAQQFESWDELRLNPRINHCLAIERGDVKFPHHRVYQITVNQSLSFDLTIPPRAA